MKRRRSRLPLVLLGMLGTVRLASASHVLLATAVSGNQSTLVRIEPTTASTVVVGSIGFPNLVGLATRSDRALFASSGQLQPVDLGSIIAVNPDTGAGTLFGPPPSSPNGPLRDLAFTHNDTLFAACNFFTGASDVADSLCTVSQANGSISFSQRVSHPGTTTLRGIEAIAFDAADSLYAATGTVAIGGPALFAVDRFNGQASLVGKVRDGSGAQIDSSVTGLQFDGTTLFGVTADNRLIVIEPATGVFTLVGGIDVAGSVQSLALLDVTPSPTPTTAPLTPTTTPQPTAGPCTAASASNPCIPGGGPPNRDCHLELLVTPVPAATKLGFPKRHWFCREGDPNCDADPDLTNRRCEIDLGLCINNVDPRLPACSPFDVTTFEVLSPNPLRLSDPVNADNLTALENATSSGFGVTVIRRSSVVTLGRSNRAPGACEAARLQVPLRTLSSGGLRAGVRRVRVRVRTSLQHLDNDALLLECRPSTCGNSVTEGWEQCDDGNRADGDGCNRGCQLEFTSPTPAPSATPATPPTPTPTTAALSTATASPVPTSTPTSTPTATYTLGTPVDTATITETPTVTPTRAAPQTFTPTPTKTPSSAVCGNGLLEGGEECDACMVGEQCSCAPADCIVCAADCSVGPCTETAAVEVFRVDSAGPAGQPVSTIKLRLGYRDTVVAITGSGSGAAASIKNRPSNTTTIVNDVNYAVEVTMSRSAGLVPGRLFIVDFKACNGAAAATPADFSCTVLDCGSAFGSVEGCTCAVVSP